MALTWTSLPGLIGISGSFFFAGGHYFTSQLTIPILYRLPTAVSTDVFQDLYYRGVKSIVPWAIFSGASFAIAAYNNRGDKRNGYVAGAVAAFAPAVFTALFMASLNTTLIEMSKDERLRSKAGNETIKALLKQWKWMNNVRGAMGALAGTAGLWAYLQKP